MRRYDSNKEFRGLSFSSEGGSQIYKKSASIKLQPPPPFRQQKFYDPHHRYTLPPKQAKIVLNSVFFNKINTQMQTNVVILWLPTFWSSKILWLPPPPHFSFQKFMTPSIFGTPHSEENDSPLFFTPVCSRHHEDNLNCSTLRFLIQTFQRNHSLSSADGSWIVTDWSTPSWNLPLEASYISRSESYIFKNSCPHPFLKIKNLHTEVEFLRRRYFRYIIVFGKCMTM